MTSPSAKPGHDSRNRAKAVQQALALEEKKKLKSRILDLVLEAYDLPSEPIASPDKASLSDIQRFKTCLSLFQPSDFDDLVRERNIDDRCGYALCSNVNKKVSRRGNKVWNHKSGQDFRVVDRSELEMWCSDKCGGRGGFVRAQLSTEPAWLRGSHNQDVRLLDEMPQADDLAEALQGLVVNESAEGDLAAKMKILSLERGESSLARVESVAILEKVPTPGANDPPASNNGDSIEGYRPR